MQHNIFNNTVFETTRVSKIKLLPFLKTTQIVVKATGSPVKKESVYFSKNSFINLVKYLSEKEFTQAKPIEIMNINGNCYMDVITSADGLFAAVQLFEYVPFTYQPVNNLYIFEGVVAEKFLSYLGKCKE
jgi:hypothetical protein